MVWKIEIERRARFDLQYAHSHFHQSALDLGESPVSALRMARIRVERTLAAADRLARSPFIGSRHDAIAPGLRHVTLDGAIFWFRPDKATETVRIVGIFHGGQDHLGRMLSRLMAEGEGAPEGPSDSG